MKKFFIRAIKHPFIEFAVINLLSFAIWAGLMLLLIDKHTLGHPLKLSWAFAVTTIIVSAIMYGNYKRAFHGSRPVWVVNISIKIKEDKDGEYKVVNTYVGQYNSEIEQDKEESR